MNKKKSEYFTIQAKGKFNFLGKSRMRDRTARDSQATQLSTRKAKKKKTEAEMNGYGGSSDSGNVNVDQNSIRPEPYV